MEGFSRAVVNRYLSFRIAHYAFLSRQDRSNSRISASAAVFMRMNAASLANHARQHHALHFFGFPALCFPLNDSDGFGQHVPFISIGWAGSPDNVLRRVVYSVISCNFKGISKMNK